MDSGGFCEVVSGVEDFVAVPRGRRGRVTLLSVEEDESAFSGDVGFLLYQFSFAHFLRMILARLAAAISGADLTES
jgi:hypothetical protein